MSPEGLLAADGTLKPHGFYNGALDLDLAALAAGDYRMLAGACGGSLRIKR
jgi:hypothetical protein